MNTTNKVIPARNSRHTVYHTDDSAGELIKQVNACVQTHNLITIPVTSYKNADRVKALLDAGGIEHPTKDVVISVYTTRGYLLQQPPFNFKHRYADGSKPWEYLEANTATDKQRLKAILESPKWKKRAEDISGTLFPSDNDDGISIVITLNDALLTNPRDLDYYDPKVIMFNPGANEFQHYCREWQKQNDKGEIIESVPLDERDGDKPDSKWKKVSVPRPLAQRYPFKLRSLYATLITGSDVVKDLIQTSYAVCREPVPQLESSSGPKRNLNISIIASKHAAKKHSGTLPILLELLNKSSFDGKATLIGDGTYGLYSFSSLRSSIEMIDGPVILKVSHPSLEQIKSLEKQLGMKKPVIKRAIIIDNVKSALRRVNEGQDVHIICEPRIEKFIQNIPEIAGLKPIRVDVDKTEFYVDNIKNRTDEERNPVAELLNKSVAEVAVLSRSRAAFNKYVRKNNVRDAKLIKLLSGLLLKVTFDIRERVEYIETPSKTNKTDESTESKSDFKFEIGVKPVVPEFNFRLGPHPHMKDTDYPKLLTFCMDMLDKHAGDEYAKKQVFWQYGRDMKNQLKRYGSKKSVKKTNIDSSIELIS